MSILDFRELARVVKATIVRELPLRKGRPIANNWLANWRADSALYVLENAHSGAVTPTADAATIPDRGH